MKPQAPSAPQPQFGPVTSITLIAQLDLNPSFGGTITILRRDGTQESFSLEGIGGFGPLARALTSAAQLEGLATPTPTSQALN